MNVQECDATGGDSSNAVWHIKINIQTQCCLKLKLYLIYLRPVFAGNVKLFCSRIVSNAI